MAGGSRLRIPPVALCSLAAVLAAATLLAGGCGEDVEIGANLTEAAGGVGLAGAAGAGPCVRAECLGKTYQCGDCLDNDDDGLADSRDPECLGACDNTEDSFYGGIPGQNAAPCKQDCYFDHDTGSGNDDCYWSHECDPESRPPDYPPSGEENCTYDPDAGIPGTDLSCEQLEETQSAECEAFCLPVTPNGCDCFGCCELPAGSGSYAWLGSTLGGVGSCDRDGLEDPERCKPCTPVDSCFNRCERCEVCVDKPSLPSDCLPSGAGGAGGADGSSAQCAIGIRPCGQAGQDDCSGDEYCISGCCVALPR